MKSAKEIEIRIAWIDDNERDLRAFSWWLKKHHDVTVEFFGSSTMFLNMLRTSAPGHWPYFLTIFDLNIGLAAGEEALPEEQLLVAGIALLEALKRKHPSSHMVVVSNVLQQLTQEDKERLNGIRQIDKNNLKMETLPNLIFNLPGAPPRPQ